MFTRTLTFVLVLLAAPLAAAQPAETAPAAPYESPQRASCDAELAKDPRWSAELEAEYIKKFHEDQSRIVTANNRHVVLAYGALWVLTAGFLALMFARQRKLVAEIARLEADVKKAAES
jgi:hypothetical protein